MGHCFLPPSPRGLSLLADILPPPAHPCRPLLISPRSSLPVLTPAARYPPHLYSAAYQCCPPPPSTHVTHSHGATCPKRLPPPPIAHLTHSVQLVLSPLPTSHCIAYLCRPPPPSTHVTQTVHLTLAAHPIHPLLSHSHSTA